MTHTSRLDIVIDTQSIKRHITEKFGCKVKMRLTDLGGRTNTLYSLPPVFIFWLGYYLGFKGTNRLAIPRTRLLRLVLYIVLVITL